MKKVYFFLFLCLIVRIAYAQSPSLGPNLIPPSPEASALAKFINIPVGHDTGIPNIEIPLYELKVGDIILPITLRYHSTGLKVYDPVGWIGMGWSLTAEPMITRNVKGLPDEHPNFGYTKPTRSIFSTELQYLISLADGVLDEQPDEFYYGLLNESGRFFFSRPYLSDTASYQILTVPYKPVKIVYDPSSKKFTIQDGNGINYIFGNTNDYIEREVNYSTTTAWKASHVYSSNYEAGIEFTYHPPKTETLPRLTDYVSVEDSLTAYYTSTECYRSNYPIVIENLNGTVTHMKYVSAAGDYGLLEPTACGGFPLIREPSAMITQSKHIQRIDFPEGNIVFEKGGVLNDRLARITVTVGGTVVKSFVFDHSYYDTYAYNKRLRLDNVRILDAESSEVQRYTFDYQSGMVPDRYLAKCMDLWGYCNGDEYSAQYLSAVPLQTVQARYENTYNHVHFEIGGSHRMPNPEYAKTGILKSITYPMGGKTYFEFEGNQFVGDGLEYGPGLRIREIKNVDSITGNTTRRVYRYGKNESGAGELRTPISLLDNMVEKQNIIIYDPIVNNYYTTRTKIYYSNMIENLFFSDGAPVRYPEVAEYEFSTTNESNGKTVYRYDDNEWPPVRIPGTDIVENTWEGWRYGKLLSREVLRNANGNYYPVEKQLYHYEPRYTGSTFALQAFRRNNIIGGYSLAYGEFEDILLHEYGIGAGESILRADTLITYTYNGDSTVSGNRYEYEYMAVPFFMLKPSTVISSRSEAPDKVTHYVYAQDTVFTGQKELGRKKLIQDWNVLQPIAGYTEVGELTERWEDEYKVVSDRAKVDVRRVLWEKEHLVQESKHVAYERYGPDGNLLQYTIDGDLTVSLIWGYNGRYPIAKIENATYAEIEAVLGSLTMNEFNRIGVTSTFIRQAFELLRSSPSMAKAMITTYTYRPLIGMTSMTDPRGITEYYEYDGFGRLIVIKDDLGNIVKTYCYGVRGEVVPCVDGLSNPEYEGIAIDHSRTNEVMGSVVEAYPEEIVIQDSTSDGSIIGNFLDDQP